MKSESGDTLHIPSKFSPSVQASLLEVTALVAIRSLDLYRISQHDEAGQR